MVVVHVIAICDGQHGQVIINALVWRESLHGLMLKLKSTYLVLKMALKECRQTCKN